jgi:hypothetical protein
MAERCLWLDGLLQGCSQLCCRLLQREPDLDLPGIGAGRHRAGGDDGGTAVYGVRDAPSDLSKSPAVAAYYSNS